MTRKPIRNLHSNKAVPPRFCDVIVDGNKVNLEIKTERNKYATIPWNDVVRQVGIAVEMETEMNK